MKLSESQVIYIYTHMVIHMIYIVTNNPLPGNDSVNAFHGDRFLVNNPLVGVENTFSVDTVFSMCFLCVVRAEVL
jgi:hypothetical protein